MGAIVNALDAMIKVAVDAHAGQVDKAGEPYILHPLAVMLDPELSTEVERAVAVGHDLLEDTRVTASTLIELGFGKEIVSAIESVTRREGEDHFDFVRRAANHRVGRKVKLADLRHNLCPSRLGKVNASTRVVLEAKYEKAIQILTDSENRVRSKKSAGGLGG